MVNKNKNNYDINTMDIQSHLDASFDMDNIKVSEELITKTLVRIKESENENAKSESKSRKDYPRLSPFKCATVAAAVFVFAVGMYAMNNGVSQKDSSMSESKSEKSENYVTSGEHDNNTLSDIYGITDYDIVAENKQGSEGMFMEEEDGSEDTVAKEDSIDNEMDKGFGIMNESAPVTNTNIISNLYPITTESVSKFTIKDENNKLLRTSNDEAIVGELYEILDKYPLIQVEDKSLEYIYQFDILTEDGQSYTILIGNGIYVKTSDELEYSYFEIENREELLAYLEEFISTIP